jgi:hypothetical protein
VTALSRPPHRPFGALTRWVVVPLLLMALGVRLGMYLERQRASPPPAVVAAAPSAPAPAPPAPVAPAANPACEVAASFQNNLYPSLMLSFGVAYPEYTRCLTVALRNLPDGPLRLRIDSTLFLQPLEVPVPAGPATVMNPELPWNFDALRRTTQMQPQSFVVTVLSEGRQEVETTLVCTVHSVNEAVSRIFLASSGQWQDTSVCFASFVNEDHPWINTLLQEAIASGTLRAFTGYQASPQGVLLQAQAVWDALAARGLSYVNVATDSGSSEYVSTQYVRFLDQSVHDQGANCVDAAVLFASVLRRIGLRPVLVFRPGHCFAGFYDAPEGGHLITFETTMLGSASFAAAALEGSHELALTAPYVGTSQYSIVDIALCRQQGINPIPYQAGARN